MVKSSQKCKFNFRYKTGYRKLNTTLNYILNSSAVSFCHKNHGVLYPNRCWRFGISLLRQHSALFHLLYTVQTPKIQCSHISSWNQPPTPDRVSLCSFGWSRTSFVFQTDLKFWDLPTSAPKFGIKCVNHHAWQNRLLRGSRLNTTLGSFLQPSPGGKTGLLVLQSLSLMCRYGGWFTTLWEGAGRTLLPTMTRIRAKWKALRSSARCHNLFSPVSVKWHQ